MSPSETAKLNAAIRKRKKRKPIASTAEVWHPSVRTAVVTDLSVSHDINVEPEVEMDAAEDIADAEVEPVSGSHQCLPCRAKRYANSDDPLKTWIPYCDEYLDELISLEGMGCSHGLGCPDCRQAAFFRCRDCFGGDVEWEDSFFHRRTLKGLGLWIQLGHPPGQRCLYAKAAHKDFMILDINGIHQVNVNFCGCGVIMTPKHLQLLQSGWWPATLLEPQTCTTLRALRHFQALNLQGKLSAYDFYRTLELRTNTMGLVKLPDRLPSFMLMIWEFQHVLMGKQAGRGHDPDGLANTPAGGLAVRCQACPIPGVNLPAGWENAAGDTRWLYRLFIHKDCNFCMSNRLRSSEERDPTLSNGQAYFVDNAPYSLHVLNHASEEDVKGCAGFATLLDANTKQTKGLRSTRKGECLQGINPSIKIVDSYDIGCEWKKNLYKCMKSLPKHLRLSTPEDRIAFLVNKFHLAGHAKKCQAPFSFNFRYGVGQSNGEGPERLWAWLNGAGPSTKEMGPGTRQDTINDFCAFMNWLKTIGMEKALLQLLVEAVIEAIKHMSAFKIFHAKLKCDRLKELEGWEKMLVEWEANHSKPCPYETSEDTMTLSKVRKMVMQEEEAGNVGIAVNAVSSATAFLILGLDVEKAQETLSKDVKATLGPTTLQAAELQNRQTGLQQKVDWFYKLQAIHMPGVEAIREAEAIRIRSTQSTGPENAKLYLPSDLSTVMRSRGCSSGLVSLEARLRHAEAVDALHNVWNYLRMQTYLSKFKIKNITGQIANTRACSMLSQVESKITSSVSRYCRSRAAYMALQGPGQWEKVLQVPKPEDVRGLNESDLKETEQMDGERLVKKTGVQVGGDTVKPGEGHQELSWIWLEGKYDKDDGDGPHMCEALQIEWAKAKARAERWVKEVALLDEEMHRTIEYCKWKAVWWENQATRRQELEEAAHLAHHQAVIQYTPTSPHIHHPLPPPPSMSPDLKEGLIAYTLEQAFYEHRRAAVWEKSWRAARTQAKASTIITGMDREADDNDEDKALLNGIPSLSDDFDNDNGLWQSSELDAEIVVTIRYDPASDLRADAAILPPLTRLHLSKLLTVEPAQFPIDPDTDVASSASYHPDSPTSSLHKSDYQPISPLLSTLGDSSFTLTTDLDLEEQHPRPFSRHLHTPLPPLHWSTPSIPYTDRICIENDLFDFLMEQVSSSATALQTAEWTHSYWIEQGKCLAGSDGLMGPQLPSWYPSEPAPVAPKA
ncbi:hypothetical protein JAAARDRAFT_198051 [Jaapia argillacea MUCL 33604]|uniref:CxC2-like cysteine cluster KDZ transposase-associated domain-containing protein n=1 Tax=Jaapia argillacea MUCL 33604 TaxID=933084 RepID=A0A067PD47_9AGAM|nr:hypothetical protein JAAARDRAFT_198051 [Jaapia argillacea MUCL 33604]